MVNAKNWRFRYNMVENDRVVINNALSSFRFTHPGSVYTTRALYIVRKGEKRIDIEQPRPQHHLQGRDTLRNRFRLEGWHPLGLG